MSEDLREGQPGWDVEWSSERCLEWKWGQLKALFRVYFKGSACPKHFKLGRGVRSRVYFRKSYTLP